MTRKTSLHIQYTHFFSAFLFLPSSLLPPSNCEALRPAALFVSTHKCSLGSTLYGISHIIWITLLDLGSSIMGYYILYKKYISIKSIVLYLDM